MRILYLILTLKRILKYLVSNKKRYANLLLLILLRRPKSIMEIGVYNGLRAKEMIEAAKIFNNKIRYYGFDLFEEFDKKKLVSEHSKTPLSKNKIKKKISKLCSVKLFKGFTSKTLPNFVRKKININFIFIDGGHAIKTIQNDWHYCSKIINKESIIMFDDYYLNDKKVIKKFGSNNLFDKLPQKKYHKKLLPLIDNFNFKDYTQSIRMFYVKLK